MLENERALALDEVNTLIDLLEAERVITAELRRNDLLEAERVITAELRRNDPLEAERLITAELRQRLAVAQSSRWQLHQLGRRALAPARRLLRRNPSGHR